MRPFLLTSLWLTCLAPCRRPGPAASLAEAGLQSLMQVVGGCLCGSVRYAILLSTADGGSVDAESISSCNCHCRMCQKSCGAPFVSWIRIPKLSFTVSCGSLTNFASSAKASRSFCGVCGTQILFHHSEYEDMVDVTIASLDNPEKFPPSENIWMQSHIPWSLKVAHIPNLETDK